MSTEQQMTNPERRQYLLDNIEKLPAKDQGFARSVATARYPSPKQWHWIGVMADRIDQPRAPLETAEVGDMRGILKMFDHYAAHHVKLPKIRLATDAGTIRLYPAGQGSAYQGCIQVKEEDGERRWIGRIDRDGKFTISPKFPNTTAIRDKLRELSSDPLGTATKHGRLMGRCCFCNIRLTDERSTQMGYGPVCADSFGLDWGSHEFSFAATPPEVLSPPVQSTARVQMPRRRIRVGA